MIDSRKSQFEALERLFGAFACGLSSRVRSGEELPLFSEWVAVLYDEWRAEVVRPLLTRREVEAYALRRLIAAPVPGYKHIAQHYLQAW